MLLSPISIVVRGALPPIGSWAFRGRSCQQGAIVPGDNRETLQSQLAPNQYIKG